MTAAARDATTTDTRSQREKWLDGECTCACAVRRVNGRLVRGDACSWSRTKMVETEHGPRLVPEPCSPDEETREDATDPDVDLAKRSVRIIAATTTGGVGLGVKRWDVARFLKNPILCDAHDQTKTIGHVQDLVVHTDGRITATAVLAAADVNPRADEIWRGIVAGNLRGLSPYVVKRADGTGELIEVSVVPVPKDPETVILRRSRAYSEARSRALRELRSFMRSDATTIGRGSFEPRLDVMRFDRSDIIIEIAKASAAMASQLAYLTRLDAKPRAQAIGTIGPINVAARTVSITASTPNEVEGDDAITEWDLSRFTKHPVVLWAHSTTELPIGTADDVVWDPEKGLSMVVRFASADANPLAEQIWRGIQEKIVRAVSVGYDKSGPSSAVLVEVSFVPVGADEDALVDEETELRKRVSSAGRELAGARSRARAARAEEARSSSHDPMWEGGELKDLDDCGCDEDDDDCDCDEEEREDAAGVVERAVAANATRMANLWRGESAAPLPALRADASDVRDEHDPIAAARARRADATANAWRTTDADRYRRVR